MAITLGNDSNFNEIVSNNKKIIVKYYASWCGSCRLFAPKFLELSEKDQYADIVFIDVNAEANPRTRRLAGVSNLPYFAIFKEGKLVETLASTKEEAVTELIEKLQVG